MLIWITLKAALRALRANKLRSFLAMLGIIIGVGAVVAMLAIGTGAQRQVLVVQRGAAQGRGRGSVGRVRGSVHAREPT